MKKLRFFGPIALFLCIVFVKTGNTPAKMDASERYRKFSASSLTTEHSLYVDVRAILSEDMDFTVVQDTLKSYFPQELLALSGDIRAVKISEAVGITGRFDFQSKDEILQTMKKAATFPGVKIRQAKTDGQAEKFAASLSAELKIPGGEGKVLKLQDCCIRLKMV